MWSIASLTAEGPRGRPVSVGVSPACLNDGRCENSRVDEAGRVRFDCVCQPGFSGKLCGELVREERSTGVSRVGKLGWLQVSPAGTGPPLLYILGPILGLILLIALAVFAGFFMVGIVVNSFPVLGAVGDGEVSEGVWLVQDWAQMKRRYSSRLSCPSPVLVFIRVCRARFLFRPAWLELGKAEGWTKVLAGAGG